MKYVEIDFPEITTRKAMSIRKSKELSAALGDPSLVSLSASKACTSSTHSLTSLLKLLAALP